MGSEDSKHSVWEQVKEQFTLGLFIILPIAATAYILWFLFNHIDNLLSPYLPIKGLGFIIVLLIVWFVGFIGQNKVGRTIINYAKAALFRTPFFGKIFKGFDQISAQFISHQNKTFETVVIVEYPKKESYTLGFMTTDSIIKFKKKKSMELVPIFIPTTPNPTSGYLLMLPKDKVTPIDIPIKEAMETIVSMGIVHRKEYIIKKL